MAKILQVHGVTTKENPQELRESARKAAEELGETYIRVFNERDKMYDVKISEVISKIINQRTKIVYFMFSKELYASLYMPRKRQDNVCLGEGCSSGRDAQKRWF